MLKNTFGADIFLIPNLNLHCVSYYTFSTEGGSFRHVWAIRLSNNMIAINDKIGGKSEVRSGKSQVENTSSVRSGMGWCSLLLGCHPPDCHFFFPPWGFISSHVSSFSPLQIVSVALLPVPYFALAWIFTHCNSSWICKTKPRTHKVVMNLVCRLWNSSMGVTGHCVWLVLDSLALSDFSQAFCLWPSS